MMTQDDGKAAGHSTRKSQAQPQAADSSISAMPPHDVERQLTSDDIKQKLRNASEALASSTGSVLDSIRRVDKLGEDWAPSGRRRLSDDDNGKEANDGSKMPPEALIGGGIIEVMRIFSEPTPLHEAVSRGDERAVRELIAAKAVVNCGAEPDGNTPLHVAAERGDMAIVDILLDAKADPEWTNFKRLTPGGLARQRGFHGLAQKLRAAGAGRSRST